MDVMGVDEQTRGRAGVPSARPGEAEDETYNPWTVVHAVFTHLVDAGLHPVLGVGGDPGAAATDLLRALGVTPDASGNREVRRAVQAHLTEIRTAVFGTG